ncbi:dihydrolipoyl dehydrogenase [Alloyangia pacifica]|uniref:dihydrolipoyl dehydrogenase n=2 Tax=Roseobacteraceae TaxID=2854170 RepID=UPI001CD1C5F1|nr:dihydrolipoyl dehydrogenase [Alloyangia pacifica]MCA0994867.1 dihydrolipoyl dehydrogenase [Alloyangia pacifica]
MPETLTCDVAVIGAGTAGIAAERNARQHGAKTLLIDPEFSGTLCANTGCMPSKLLIAAGRSAQRARGSGLFGIRTGKVSVDGPAVLSRLRDERDRFAAATRQSFDDLPAGTCLRGRARFTGENALVLDDGTRIEAKAVIIATGAQPMVPPPFRDLGDRLLTNETIFELPDLPRSLAVIGAGVIGVELAQAMARLGVRVTIFDLGDRLAGARSDAVHAALKSALEAELDLQLGVEPTPELTESGVTIRWDGGAESFDKVLVASGRPPSLQGLDLEATGLDLDDKGMPEVDPATLQCGEAPIFMAGDANAERPVLHEASAEGAIAGRNAAAFPAVIRSERSLPFTITFTDPPLVSLGEGPEEASAIGTASYADQGRARVEGENHGVAQIYAAEPDGRLLGADLCCAGADHMGHMLGLAVQQKLTVGDLLALPVYHPTLEEGLRGALREICEALSLPGGSDGGGPSGA